MADYNLTIGIEKPNVSQAQAGLTKIFKILDKIDRSAKRANKSIGRVGSSSGGKGATGGNRGGRGGLSRILNIAAGNLTAIATSKIIKTMTQAITAFGNAAKRAANDSAEFENSIVSISRISGIAEDDIRRMSEEFLSLSTAIPVSVSEFQKFAEIASRFGIDSAEGVANFAESFGKLQSVIGDVSEATVKSVARIIAITKFNPAQIDQFNNAILVLGKNFATTEDQIIRTAERISGDINEFSQSASDVLGLSTAFDALGIKSELGGSALVRILDAIQEKALSTGADFERLREFTGDTAEAFRDMALNSPVQTLVKLTQSGKSGSEVMDRLGLAGVRVQGVLARLAGNTEIVAESMRIAGKETKSVATINEDAARQANTNASKMERLSNSIQSAFIGIGDQSESSFGALLDDTISLVGAFTGLDKEAVALSPNIAKLGDATRDLFEEGVDSAQEFVDSIEQIAPVFNTIIQSLSKVISLFGSGVTFAADFWEWSNQGIFDEDFKNFDEIRKGIGEIKSNMEEIDDLSLDDLQGNALKLAVDEVGKPEDKTKTRAEIKRLEEIRAKFDEFNKRNSDIKFESELKELGLDDIDKRIARLQREFDKNLLTLNLDTPEVQQELKTLQDEFQETLDNLTVSGLIDDVKSINDEINKSTQDQIKLNKQIRGLSDGPAPELTAITSVVGAAKFIQDNKRSDKRIEFERKAIELKLEEIDIEQQILKATRKEKKSKIVNIRGN